MKTNLTVSVQYAKPEELDVIRAALETAGLGEKYDIVVTDKSVAQLHMEDEVFVMADNYGFQVDGYEEQLAEVAYKVLMEDEYLSEKQNEAILEKLNESGIPEATDSDSNESDTEDAPVYLGVTPQKTYPMTREQIPHFIMLFGQKDGLRVVDALDQVVLTTLPGAFLDRVFNRELHQELLQTLIPMQQGQVEPTNFWVDEEE